MAKKELLSLAAASLMAATLVGCGSSCRPGTDCTNGSTTPDTNTTVPDTNTSTGATDIKAAAPAAVLEAALLKGTVPFTTSSESIYTWNDTVAAAFSSSGGAVDTNENGMADAQDPLAPNMKAPIGSSNINPFTTLQENGLSLDAINSYYGIALESTDIDLATADLNVYKAASKATLELAYTQKNPEGNKCNTTGCLLNPMQVAPCVPYELIVCDNNPDTSSGDDAIPESLKNTFVNIDAADNRAAVNQIVQENLGMYSGFFVVTDGNTTGNP